MYSINWRLVDKMDTGTYIYMYIFGVYKSTSMYERTHSDVPLACVCVLIIVGGKGVECCGTSHGMGLAHTPKTDIHRCTKLEDKP